LTRSSRHRRAPFRLGYSLDDAAAIRRKIVTAQTRVIRCPECGEHLESVVGGEGVERVWLLRCGGCSRAIVVVLTETHPVEV
jgi:hypothetical protein